MKTATRVHIAAASLIGVACIVWIATGAEGYTRWPDERLARSDAPRAEGESELLSEAGFADDHAQATTPDIQSRFALGLMPGGFTPHHLLSVVTVAAVALSASGTALVRSTLHRAIAIDLNPESKPGAHS